MINFSGCKSTEGSGCSVKSSGDSGGDVLFGQLKGELGSVKTPEAPSGVGLLLSPTSGTTFTTLEGPCLVVSPAPMDGSLAAEIRATGEEGKTAELIFTGSKGTQAIKEINVLGKVEKPSFLGLGLLSTSEEAADRLTFKNAFGGAMALKSPSPWQIPVGEEETFLALYHGSGSASDISVPWESKAFVEVVNVVPVPCEGKKTLNSNETCEVRIKCAGSKGATAPFKVEATGSWFVSKANGTLECT